MNIFLVDDGSTDGTSDVIRSRFPKVEVIAGDGTLWWSGATNLGIRRALSVAAPEDYILLVNNDTFFEPDFLARCREAVKKYPKSLIGSVIVDPRDRRILQGGIRINWYSAKHTWINLGKCIDDFPSGHIETVSVVTGRGVLVPCETYWELGLYEDYYLEQHGDTELARRANLKGYPLLVDYGLLTYNSGSMSAALVTGYRSSELFKYFFGRSSKMRLRTRYWFAVRTAANPVQGASYFVCDLGRILKNLLYHIRVGESARQS